MLISAYPWIRPKELLSLRMLQLTIFLVVQPTFPADLALQSGVKAAWSLTLPLETNPPLFLRRKSPLLPFSKRYLFSAYAGSRF